MGPVPSTSLGSTHGIRDVEHIDHEDQQGTIGMRINFRRSRKPDDDDIHEANKMAKLDGIKEDGQIV